MTDFSQALDFVRDPDLSVEEGYWCHSEGMYFTEDPSEERFLIDGHYGYDCLGPHVNALVWIGDEETNTVIPFVQVPKKWTAIARVGRSTGYYSEVSHLLIIDHYYGPGKSIAYGKTLCGRTGKSDGKGIRKCQTCTKVEASAS